MRYNDLYETRNGSNDGEEQSESSAKSRSQYVHFHASKKKESPYNLDTIEYDINFYQV
jgi:hypothetical protein